MQEYRSYRKRGQSAAPKEIHLEPITEPIDPVALRIFGSAILAKIIEDLEWTEAQIAAGTYRVRPKHKNKNKKLVRDQSSKTTIKELDGIEAMCSVLMDNAALQHWADCADRSLYLFRRHIIRTYPLTYKLATKGM